MRQRKPMVFATIPDWTCAGKEAGVLTFFESIFLAELENRPIRLSADTQRMLLGAVLFGRREITVRENGIVECTGDTCYGRDSDTASWSAETMRLALQAGLELHPTITGPGYFSRPRQD